MFFLSDYSMAKLISLQTTAVRQCHRQKVPGANEGILHPGTLILVYSGAKEAFPHPVEASSSLGSRRRSRSDFGLVCRINGMMVVVSLS